MSAPCSRRALALSDAVDADDEAEAAGAPRVDAGERILEDGSLCRRDAERVAPRRETCRVPACR